MEVDLEGMQRLLDTYSTVLVSVVIFVNLEKPPRNLFGPTFSVCGAGAGGRKQSWVLLTSVDAHAHTHNTRMLKKKTIAPHHTHQST